MRPAAAPTLVPHGFSNFCGFWVPKLQKLSNSKGRSFALGFIEGGTARGCYTLSNPHSSLFFNIWVLFSRSRSWSTWRRKKTDLELPGCIFNTVLLICLFRYVCKVHGHGQTRMDVPDIEVESVLPGSCEKVCCRWEKASSESEATAHQLSV